MKRKALPGAIFAGLLFIGLTVAFTYWLGIQDFTCPDWANDCHVQKSVAWISREYSFVQGVVSTVHGLGLSLLAYPALMFAEAAIWPILTQHSYDLQTLDNYLSATRGSIPGLLQAIRNLGNGEWSTIMICAGLLTTLSTLDRTVVGQVYNFGNVTKTYTSTYATGGGMGIAFNQSYPPGPAPDPVTSASSLYISWSKNLSSEPLPEIRDFIVDRTFLAKIGSISISALRASKTIECSGTSLDILDDDDPDWFTVNSNYPEPNSPVRLRIQPRLSVWVDDVAWISEGSTTTTLVFALQNGTIENGISTPTTEKIAEHATTLQKKTKGDPINSISGLKCTVATTLVQDTIRLGTELPLHNGSLSSVTNVIGPGCCRETTQKPLSEVAHWMAAVVASTGTPIYGAQPMFAHNGPTELPAVLTTTQLRNVTDQWTQAELENFIDVTSGALALAMSAQSHGTATLTSRKVELQLVPSRAWYLLAPAAAVLITTAFLAIWVSRAYRDSRIQGVRAGKTSDMIWSTQNRSMRDGVEELRSSSHGSEKLDEMKVRYTLLADENMQMGLTWDNPEQPSSDSNLGTPLKDYPSYTGKQIPGGEREYV